jgi:aldehyde dehydrogenase (NAD+)
MGPLVDQVQFDYVTTMVRRGEAEGGTLIQAACPLPAKGSYFPPSLFVDVGTSSSVMQDEIFGAVISAMTFRTPDKAVALANRTRYGLAASIWFENINLALDTASRVKAGVAGSVGADCSRKYKTIRQHDRR